MDAPGPKLFVALYPTDAVGDALAGLYERIPRLSWTLPVRLHLTLRYIGVQPLDIQDRAMEALDKVDVKRFLLPVEGVGGFPEKGEPRVLWAGTASGHPFLFRLRQQVDDALLAAGIDFELRPFAAHITVGRCAQAPATMVKQWLKKNREFTGPIWPVTSFSLMVSEPSPTGKTEHRELQRYSLK